MLVTTRSHEEVRTELDDARRAGIVVFTGDDLPALIARTLVLPNADQAYIEAERTLRDSGGGIPTEPELPLDG